MLQAYAIQLTPRGTGAIAVILLAGRDIPTVLGRVTAKSLPPPGVAARMELHAPGQPAEVLDDALLVHTGPNRCELHLHGGAGVTAAALDALAQAGAATLPLEEAAARGLFGDALDADIQLALPLARTPSALRVIQAQREQLLRWRRRWNTFLETHPEADLWRFHAACQELLARSTVLLQLLAPPRIAIVGPPNAGKSTLANALLGRPVSITSDIPGTTRDWVDAHALFAADSPAFPEPFQVEVVLVDTAGIRVTDDPLEVESIARSHHQAAAADLVIILLDATRQRTPQEQGLAGSFQNRPHIVVLNKIDAAASIPPLGEREAPPSERLAISALHRANLPLLMQRCIERFDLHNVTAGEPFLFSARQRDIVREALRQKSGQDAMEVLEQLAPAKSGGF
jgi:tRNA modification GTPase